MPSTLKATSFHALMLAAFLATTGGIMQHNMSRSAVAHGVEALVSGFDTRQQVAPIQKAMPRTHNAVSVVRSEVGSEPQASVQAAQPVVRETTAQKRARYAPHIAAAAQASNVDADLIEAIITAESAFDPAALSRTGALGLMQLMPATAQRFGVTDRLDPAQNILGGARYLQFLLGKFNNNLKLAVAAYNAGEGNVKKHGNRIPPFKETIKYVPKVLAYYKKYSAES